MHNTDQEVPRPKRFPGYGQKFGVVAQQDGHISPTPTSADTDTDDGEYPTGARRQY